jgi:hypothetical protein
MPRLPRGNKQELLMDLKIVCACIAGVCALFAFAMAIITS